MKRGKKMNARKKNWQACKHAVVRRQRGVSKSLTRDASTSRVALAGLRDVDAGRQFPGGEASGGGGVAAARAAFVAVVCWKRGRGGNASRAN